MNLRLYLHIIVLFAFLWDICIKIYYIGFIILKRLCAETTLDENDF